MTEGGRLLALEVRRRGLSERGAARLVGCDGSGMHRYLKDGRVPDGEILFRISRVFGIEPHLFYEPAKRPRAKRSPRTVAA